MKKIISFCFLLCTIITCFTITSVNAADLKKTDVMKQGGLLQAIGIIDSVADETEGNREISRAEFAVMVGKTMGMTGMDEKTRYFTDVPMSHWAVSYINKLAEMKIIAFSEDNLFRPNDKITLNEAVKMLVSTLGYGQLAEYMGGFPNGYSQLAGKLDFTVSGGVGAMTIYQSYILIYDALKSETYDMNSIENGNIVYKESGETLLSTYFDIYEEEGIVVQSTGISIDGKTDEGFTNDETKRIVRIGDKKYITDIDFYDYLGRRTCVYYHQEDDDDDRTIVYREDYKKDDDVTDITTDDFVSFKNSILTYSVGNKNKTIRIPIGAFVVKNGEVIRENTANALNIKKGNIRVIDIEDDGTVDVVLVWEYKNILADIINTDTFEIYDKIIKQNKVQLDQDDKIVLIEDVNGNKKSFSDIKSGSLISVYESQRYAKVVINEEPVSAELYSLSFDGEQYKAQLGKSVSDKVWYDIDMDFYNNYLKGKSYIDANGNEVYTGDINLPLGTSVTYYKDVCGNIAYITGLNLTEWIYGYLVRIAEDDTFDNNTFVKVFTQYGDMKTYQCADKVMIDGIRKKDYEEIRNALKKEDKISADEDDIHGQLIRFKLSSDDKINAIDTRKFNSDKEDRLSLRYTGSMQNSWIWYESSSFHDCAHYYDNSTVKFGVPEHSKLENATYDNFSIISSLRDDTTYNFEGYRLDPKGILDTALVIYDNGTSFASEKGPYLVAEVYQAVDEDSIITQKANLYDIGSGDMISVTAGDGYEFEYNDANGNSYAVGEGDIIYISVDTKGKVQSVSVYNDYSRMNDADYSNPTGWKNVNSMRLSTTFTDLLSARVKSFDDGFYRLVYGTELEESDLTDANYSDCSCAMKNDIASVLIYNGIGITKGTTEDIIPAMHTGAASAKIYWFGVKNAVVTGAVIYDPER